jgi:TRAP-type mannitol/chloroaromatic compound transport system permease large subunit
MGFLFLFLGYLGVPVAFALIASVLIVTMFTPVSEASMIAQIFNGMDVEALMAVPFFLLVGDLMTFGKRHHAHDRVVADTGRSPAWRPCAGCDFVQHVFRRYFRLVRS